MKFQNTYNKLPERFFSPSQPQPFSDPQLLAFNTSLAEDLGLKPEQEPEKLAAIFSGQKKIDGASFISTVYAAHQFGHFVPRLGDGRALIMGEVVSPQEKRFDIQLKGSGPTAYSRNGDGLSPLGPVVREYILSEAMYKLGVPTTRALAAVATGEKVYRQQGELPGGVFTRVAASHIRIGTFQYFASKGDLEGLVTLLEYCIDRHYPEIKDKKNQSGEKTAVLFLKKVIENQIKTVARWMSIGFIHGVMNTDNTTVTGETIDYGPCAFMDSFRHDQVYSSIDSGGRYAYKNQPLIISWNLCRLADCLLPLVDKNTDKAIEMLNEVLGSIHDLFEDEWRKCMIEKFGLTPSSKVKNDTDLINQFLDYLEKEKLDFTLSFRNLADLTESERLCFFPSTKEFENFKKIWKKRLVEKKSTDTELKTKMNSVNPLYIARNHQVERAIEKASKGDLSVFENLNTVLKEPFKYNEQLNHFSLPPSTGEEVRATFCGT